MQIIPSILEKDFDSLREKLEFLSNAKQKYNLDFNLVQIDFCDGIFVENKTWLPDDIIDDKQIDKFFSFTKSFDIEYHLMCKDQYKYFLLAEKLNAKKVIVHIDEILDNGILDKIIEKAKERLTKIIICGRLDFLEKNINKIISILMNNNSLELQIMGIREIGVQGADFDEKCIDIIKNFRKLFNEKELSIQIDGSINEDTIKYIKPLNVNKVVIGSYFLKDLDESVFVYKFKKIKQQTF